MQNMKKAILIDLDGTLTDTADISFKSMKDGVEETDLTKIKLLSGAVDFVKELIKRGHIVFIISDSHPKYVNKIVGNYFGVPSLSLANKPNSAKTRNFLTSYSTSLQDVTEYFMIGDTWLDIELGRGVGSLTVLTELYKPQNVEERDGIGQDWKNLKSGPTFYANKYSQILDIIENSTKHLLCAEAVFQNEQTVNAVKFKTQMYPERFIAYRTLGRQNAGEIDRFAIGDKYFEFGRIDRTPQTLQKLASGVEEYINTLMSYELYIWDFFTYVSDKATTNPPNKMKGFFDIVNVAVPKVRLIEWKTTVTGSIRNMPNYRQRQDFVIQNIDIDTNIDLKGKNIIIIDDQFTTGGTAFAICQKLIDRGARNLLFLSLFYLVTTVESERACPHCGTKLQVKINRKNGNKFYSCVAPQYGGTGCGKFIETIV